MVVPYPRMPKNVVGRGLWIGLTSAIVLAFLTLSTALIVLPLASNPTADRPADADRPGGVDPLDGADLLLPIAIGLACLLGVGLFAWILADGLRNITRERAEARRREAEIREIRIRTELLRARRHRSSGSRGTDETHSRGAPTRRAGEADGTHG